MIVVGEKIVDYRGIKVIKEMSNDANIPNPFFQST